MKLVRDLGVVFLDEYSRNKHRCGVYICNFCSQEFKAMTSYVNSGKIKRCRNCKGKKHGLHKHKLYMVWAQEKQRCYNKNATSYDGYGARGIIVSDEFLDFSVWLKYVESLDNAYKDNYTIDRANNDGNYERGNLRWSSKSEQARNTRILHSKNTTGYRGVTKNGKKWKATISVNKKRIHIGTHETKEEAATAYNKYVLENNLEHTINKMEMI